MYERQAKYHKQLPTANKSRDFHKTVGREESILSDHFSQSSSTELETVVK